MNVVLFKYHFKPHWAMIALTLFAMALFMRLGFWQLDRANEKKQMITMARTLSQEKSIKWSSGEVLPKQYQRLRTEGHFLPTVLLLDNQHYQHQLGYDVLSPLALANGHVVLVDRGWVAADLMQRVLPSIDIPNGLIQLEGSAYYPSKKNWLLGPAMDKKNANLAVVELIDTQLISQFLHKSVYPFIIRLSSQAKNGFVRDWPVVAMSVDRHYGYAFQWFAIALAIFIIFIVLNMKKKV